jgi:diguanylate cyclase (GGDEF)-like protein/PAS domain S-box-containing protein
VTNEKQLRDEVELQKKRMELAVEATRDGLWDWDLVTDEAYHSRQFERMLGYDGNELPYTSQAWSLLVHPEDINEVFARVKRYLTSQGNQPYKSVFRMKHKNGEWRWIEAKGKAIFDKQGNPTRFIGFNHDITEQLEQTKRIEYSAKHDMLTGLPNRFLFDELLHNALQRTKRSHARVGLIYLDLDGFKAVNDQYGHHVGDRVLVQIAHRLEASLRTADFLTRHGGDEFIICLSEMQDDRELMPILERLLERVNEPLEVADGHEAVHVGASIGVTTYPQETELGADALIRQADLAMYEAKASGKNQYLFFSALENKSFSEILELKSQLIQAIDNNAVHLHYQPKYDVHKHRLCGVEALLRLQIHPGEPWASPQSFLSVIEYDATLAQTLGRWVFEEAFEQLAQWNMAGMDIDISLNVSAHEMEESHVLPLLTSLFHAHPAVRPEQIELEILESSAINHPEKVAEVIRQCKHLGVKIALDDFGTGYASLSYFKHFPVDTLKIDRGFITELHSAHKDFSIVRASIGLAQAFHCQVVAEGVETQRVGETLIKLGCDVIQGFIVATPMKASAIPDFFQSYAPPDAWRACQEISPAEKSILQALNDLDVWRQNLKASFSEQTPGSVHHILFGPSSLLSPWLRAEGAEIIQNSETLAKLNDLNTQLSQQAHRLMHRFQLKREPQDWTLIDRLVQTLSDELAGCLDSFATPAE